MLFRSQEAETYVSDGSPLDKAGAYGIQDDDFQPVDVASLRDCFANVMGLPLCALEECIAELGMEAGSGIDLYGACAGIHPNRHPPRST